MNKILSALTVGLIAGGLSVSAFALDAAKPAASKDPVATSASAKPAVEVKKETGIKASLKKLLPHAKDAKEPVVK